MLCICPCVVRSLLLLLSRFVAGCRVAYLTLNLVFALSLLPSYLQKFQEEINQQDNKVLGMQTTCFKFMAEANVSYSALIYLFDMRNNLSGTSTYSLPLWLQCHFLWYVLRLLNMHWTYLLMLKEYGKAMDAYRETIHKPLPKSSIKYPEPRLQAATDKASEQYAKLKSINYNARDKVRLSICGTMTMCTRC